MSNPKKTGLSHSQMATKLGISQQRVTKLVEAGMPIHSEAAAREWQDARRNSAPVDVAGAKLRKTMLEVERLEIQNAQARGELINRAEVREAGVQIGAILSAECQALVNDLTGQIAGQSEEEVRPKLQGRIDLLLDRVKTKLDEST